MYWFYRFVSAVTVVTCLTAAAAPAGNTGRVTVNGHQFQLNGKPYYYAGTNFWQGMNLGSSGAGGDRAQLGRELDRLADMGVTNVRVMAASEGPDTEPYRMVPSLQTSPGVYNEDVFEGLDYLLAELDQRNMRAVMVLNNMWHWSGGMAQYVSWKENSPIPYPNVTHDWDAYQDYAAKFYDYQECQQWYQDHIETVINRVNTVNGKRYKDDPTIFSWQLANEPRRYPEQGDWVDSTAAFIKSLSPDQLVTVGSEGEMGVADFVGTHDGPNIDYATCHIWPQNWGWFNPLTPSTYASAETEALDYWLSHADDAENVLEMPLVLEEFGLARDYSGPLYDIYDPDSPTTYRDQFFSAMFEAVYDSAAAGGPGAGTNFWAWSGESLPGDTWIGDPPHEIPGWYAVYATDASTLGVIRDHAAQMQSLIPEPTAAMLLGLGGLVLLRRRA